MGQNLKILGDDTLCRKELKFTPLQNERKSPEQRQCSFFEVSSSNDYFSRDTVDGSELNRVLGSSIIQVKSLQ